MFPCQFRGSLSYTLSVFVSISHYFFRFRSSILCRGRRHDYFLCGEGAVRISDQGDERNEGRGRGRKGRKWMGGMAGGEYGEKGTDKWTEGVEGNCLLGICRS